MEEKKIELEKLDLPIFREEEEGDFVKVTCPSCKTQTKAKNIDLESKIGKCTSCDAIFSVKEKLDLLEQSPSARVEVVRPEGVELFHFRNEMEIELAPPFPMLDGLILALVPFIIGLALAVYLSKGIDGGLIVAGVSLIVLLKGIIRLVKRKQYKSILTITKDQIYVKQRPRGLSKDKQYSVLDLDQVYVKYANDGIGLFFVINGEQGQRHEKVLGRHLNGIKLKYIEHEIEKYLGIPDKKVGGEM